MTNHISLTCKQETLNGKIDELQGIGQYFPCQKFEPYGLLYQRNFGIY